MERYEQMTKNKYVYVKYVLALAMVGFLTYYHWLTGLFFLLLLLVLFIFEWRKNEQSRSMQIQYVKQLMHRIDRAGEHIFIHMPIGVVIYNEDYEIEWCNRYSLSLMKEESLRGKSLSVISDTLIDSLQGEEEKIALQIHDEQCEIEIDRKNQALFIFNRTKEKHLEAKLAANKLVLATIYLDNYKEISRNMADNVKSRLNSEVTAQLNNWAENHQFYMKRTSQERFIAVLTKEILDSLETSRFDILEKIRAINVDGEQRNPVTISIGIGTGDVSLLELSQLAQSSLDLALGRGGDQVVIRDETGKARFYGGKTNPMEKRTRVRARVISHALKDLIKDSDNVLIMGHKTPDLDSLGATLGVLHIAKTNGVDGFVVFNDKDVTTGVDRVIDKVKQEESLWKYFIGPEEAESIRTNRSLIVIVDTHRPSLVTHEKLLHEAQHVVVIDHHRRGEEFIQHPTLVYMEPYASSTSELVTELIEYQSEKKRLSTLEATALLAGIIVDTKSFALRTGSRTFDAASYLRSQGADLVLIQHFLKEDLATVIKRNQLIERASIYRDSVAIATANEEEIYDTITIAQAADMLLTVDRVEASFVIAPTDDKTIAISARSLGEINVQLIMEAMGGGGHLTNAATQIKELSMDEIEKKLKAHIDTHLEGSL